MSEKRKPKVIILESDENVCRHVEAILLKEGWDVTCAKVSKEALNHLATSKKILFTLFISNFKLPKMEGDDILSKVKSISPLTQRMLIIPGDKPQILIKAINKATIHACVISPIQDKVLINQTNNCLKQFKHALKRARLKRVTSHQNKQMFNIARKLKKKNNAYQKLISEKKAQKIRLKSKKRELQNQALLDTDINLASLLEHKKIPPTPEIYQKEFSTICEKTKILFDQLTTQHSVDPVQLDFASIFNTKEPESDEPKPDAEKLDEQTEEIAPEENKTQDQTETSEPNEPGEPDPIQIKPDHQNLIDHILKATFTSVVDIKEIIPDAPLESEKPDTMESEHVLDEYFEVTISKNQTQAFLKRIKNTDDGSPTASASDILDLLLQKDISYGILDDAAIEIWLSKPDTEKICIAQGEEAIQGKNGSIQFDFQTDYTNPGKISEDGRIDFRDRGDIPYIHEKDLLAKKTLAKEGKAGISISGTPIPVEEVFDPVFEAGNGAQLSEDKTSIHATINGQPHLDKLGTISVSPELVIPGDVDYETGNIDFKGNIIIKGIIKEGFTVKGINLTVKEIEGGTVDLSGDLNVSDGITESKIHTHGNTQAKFINHSTVMGFGDLTVSKEIIDSKIILSGCCFNNSGHIISSQVTAKLGIEAGNIGTSSSTPVKLKVGIEEHLTILNKQIDEDLEQSIKKASVLKEEVKKLEEQDQTLYEQISEKAHIQDRAQIEISDIKKSMPQIENSNDLTQLHRLSNKIKKLKKNALKAEKELNDIFIFQDQIANEIESFKTQIKLLEEKNKTRMIEKKALKEFSIKDPANAVVSIAKTITQDSMIKGPHSSKILREDASRCKILELASEQDGIILHEMKIVDL